MARKQETLSLVDADLTTPLTGPQYARLECVKLAFRHDRTASDAVAKAAELERFVIEGKPAAPAGANAGQVGPEADPS